MFHFIIGIIWLLIVTPMVVPLLAIIQAPMGIFIFLFIMLFEIIGVYLTISGLKQIIKDNKTKNYGIKCYGIVRELKYTGSYLNDSPEYKALLDIVNPETNQIESLEEIVGFNGNKYPVNSYVQCKYFEGDINFDKVVSENEIPGGIKKLLVPIKQQKPEYMDLEFSPDREYVTIDGVKYKKVI